MILEEETGGSQDHTNASHCSESNDHCVGVSVEEHEGREEGHGQAGGDNGLNLHLGHVGDGEATEHLTEQYTAATTDDWMPTLMLSVSYSALMICGHSTVRE